MRAAIFVIVVAACGGTRRTPAPVVANVAPAAIDAGVPADEPDDACETTETQTMRVGGKDTPVRLIVCTLGETHEGGEDGYTYRSKRAELVLDRAGDPVTVALGEWQDGGEDGGSWHLLGALASPGGEAAMLVEGDSYGPAPDLAGQSAVVRVMAVRGGAWEKVYEVQASVISMTASTDRRVVTLATCESPAGATPTYGGGCDHDPVRYEGDGATIELRWDGASVSEARGP